uniref:Uncharacterized protein n=1 Tax=Octopus bimaculoides TaxID=37653 RepID=A0A0L8HRE6_OCTBM
MSVHKREERVNKEGSREIEFIKEDRYVILIQREIGSKVANSSYSILYHYYNHCFVQKSRFLLSLSLSVCLSLSLSELSNQYW